MVTRIHEKAMKIEATSWTRPGTEKGARIRMEKVFWGRKIKIPDAILPPQWIVKGVQQWCFSLKNEKRGVKELFQQTLEVFTIWGVDLNRKCKVLEVQNS